MKSDRRSPGAAAAARGGGGGLSTKQFFGIDLRPFRTWRIPRVTLMLARKLAADELGDERTYLPP